MRRYAYVGCYTTENRKANGKGIKVYEIEGENSWKLIQTVNQAANPSFLCFDREEKFLYSIHGDLCEINSFSIDRKTGMLAHLNSSSTEGYNPVHLTVDKTNRWIFVANLQTGTVAVILRNENGTLGMCRNLYLIDGKVSSTFSHPHSVFQDPYGEFLFVSCQGRENGFGQVVVFRIDSKEGVLNKTCVLKSREIAEPRHMVCMPDGIHCYGINEIDYTITSYLFDRDLGILHPYQIVSSLPDNVTEEGWASGIICDPNHKFIIISNRKHDSISSFCIDETTGKLNICDCIKTGGKNPRFIGWDPFSQCILAANEISGDIREFSIDKSGILKFSGFHLNTESPACVIFSEQ